jgi:biopolymer transport protein ExbD
LLLIFFMVAGTVSRYASLQLPESTTGDTENPQGRVVVVLDFPERLDERQLAHFGGGKPILLNEARISIEGTDGRIDSSELKTRLAEHLSKQGGGQLIVQAHRKMPSSVVREVVRIAKLAGAQETLVGVSVPH